MQFFAVTNEKRNRLWRSNFCERFSRAELEALKAENATMKSENTSIKTDVEALKNAVYGTAQHDKEKLKIVIMLVLNKPQRGLG